MRLSGRGSSRRPGRAPLARARLDRSAGRRRPARRRGSQTSEETTTPDAQGGPRMAHDLCAGGGGGRIIRARRDRAHHALSLSCPLARKRGPWRRTTMFDRMEHASFGGEPHGGIGWRTRSALTGEAQQLIALSYRIGHALFLSCVRPDTSILCSSEALEPISRFLLPPPLPSCLTLR
jgi:hypothetical protein